MRETTTEEGFTKLIFEGAILAPDGRKPVIRTVWRLNRDTEAHFVTAVPLGRDPRRNA